jgi:antitoxin HigA-1
MSLLKNPVHPGDILKHEFLIPLEMSEGRLAKHLGVPRTRIERLVKGTTGVTTDTAVRLARFFGSTPQFWVNMQVNYEMAKAEGEIDVSDIEPLSLAC